MLNFIILFLKWVFLYDMETFYIWKNLQLYNILRDNVLMMQWYSSITWLWILTIGKLDHNYNNHLVWLLGNPTPLIIQKPMFMCWNVDHAITFRLFSTSTTNLPWFITRSIFDLRFIVFLWLMLKNICL